MASKIEIQKQKIAELEHLLAPVAEQVIGVTKIYKHDIKKDVFQYFVGRISTFQEGASSDSADMKMSLLSILKRKYNIADDSMSTLSDSLDSIDSFFSEVKSFENSERVSLKMNDWTKYMKEKLFY